MVMFADSIKSGEIPNWSQGFANYGYPLALIAHQLPAYLGAGLILIGLSPETVFSTIIVVSTLASGIGMYIFISNLLSDKALTQPATNAALLGASVWLLSSYRLMNIYSRGAIPELFAAALIPFLLSSIVLYMRRQRTRYLAAISLLSFLLVITHPMMLLIAAPLILATTISTKWRSVSIVSLAIVIGILVASYYIVPLYLELKYLYLGANGSSIGNDTYLSLKNFFVWRWPYFPIGDHPGPRVGPIQVGVPEFAILLLGYCVSIYLGIKKSLSKATQLLIWVTTATISLTLTTRIAQPLYEILPVLDSIQFPWRFLLPYQFAVSVVIAMLAYKYHMSARYILIGIVILAVFRLPEAYGKNFTITPLTDYQFNQENLHSTTMNPVWVGDTNDYPVTDSLFSIVEGAGTVTIIQEKPSSRIYMLEAETPVRVSFNTFYFPGWQLEVNGQPTETEYQDPNFRGVMTTRIEGGKHELVLLYNDTRVRLFAKLVSLVAIVSFLLVLWLHTRQKNF